MNTETANLTGYTTTASRFGNRHHERTYPAGTLVELLGGERDGWAMARVVGTRSIKGFVKVGTVRPA